MWGYSDRYLAHINIDALPSFYGINFNLFRFKKFEHFAFVLPNHFIHLAFGHVNYAASFFLNVYDFKTKKSINYSADNIYRHGSFPNIPDQPSHCESYIFEKQKEDFYISNEAVEKNGVCSVHMIIKVKDINAFADFEISMGNNNIYDVIKLNKEGSRWFYGKKTLNNKCAINLYLNHQPHLYE